MKRTDYREIMRICEELEQTGGILDLEDVSEASNKVSRALEDVEGYDQIETLIASSELAFMEQGFIYGFKYAMQLKKECEIS